jgi:predicted flap endonuclease-1-like 5' DNA nuclease
MTTLIGQMLGCLIVAAGIGGAVGWLLRNISARPLAQQLADVIAMMRFKEQILEKAQHDLKIQAATVQTLESKIIELEESGYSTQQELSTRNDRLKALEEELAVRSQQLTVLEAETASLRLHANEHATSAAQLEEAHQLHLMRDAAQQTLESNERERQNLERRIAELDAIVAEAERLRARVEELEPVQGRVHWLEVQLSDREAEHRAALHQLNSQLAERDRRIGQLKPLAQRLQEQEAALAQWEAKYAHALTKRDAEIARLQQQVSAQDELRTQLLLDKQLLHERDERINVLQQRIHEIEAQQQGMEYQVQTAKEKEEEIVRLRKRLGEVRAALRIKSDGGTVAPRRTPQNERQLHLQIDQAKAVKNGPKDDLSKIHGIGPVFARSLNKMGLYTYVQIARWKPEDIARIAKKLYTTPVRIKREKWVAAAKRQHLEKYGEKL